MKNIIFLDIDGVLTSDNSFVNQLLTIDYGCIEFFLEGLSKIDSPGIVISSSWRKTSFEKFVEKIKQQMPDQYQTFLNYVHPDWRTPELPDGFRGKEINQWQENRPEIEKILCVDDESDYFNYQPLLQTLPEYGFGNCEKDLMVAYFTRKKEMVEKYCRPAITAKIKKLEAQRKFISEHQLY